MPRTLTRQKQDRIRRVMTLTHLAHRHSRVPLLDQPLHVSIIILLCQTADERCMHQTRHYRVQSDTLGGIYHCSGSCELQYGGFSRGVGDLRFANVAEGSDGGEIDYCAGFLGLHDGQDVVAH